jgi:hypothetical protein
LVDRLCALLEGLWRAAPRLTEEPMLNFSPRQEVA